MLGDALEQLKTLPDGSVHCCVTSPPYYGLRDYGVAGQIGLEDTPEAYVARLVEVFREVRRVLRDDGTLWPNIGDSYAAQRGGTHQPAETLAGGKGGKMADGSIVNRARHAGCNPTRNAAAIGLKHKDLIGIPWMLAFALRADGWYLRQDIIWHKPNPMPESVRDRCTKSHEYIFLFAKQQRYYFDQESIKVPLKEASVARLMQDVENQEGSGRVPGKTNGKMKAVCFGGNKQCPDTRLQSGKEWNPTMIVGGMANKKSVWTVPTRGYKGAHFATFPPQLISPCILAGCPVDGTVLDPFSGSGTTGQVAKSLGRNAILIELNPAYHDLIRSRLQLLEAC